MLEMYLENCTKLYTFNPLTVFGTVLRKRLKDQWQNMAREYSSIPPGDKGCKRTNCMR